MPRFILDEFIHTLGYVTAARNLALVNNPNSFRCILFDFLTRTQGAVQGFVVQKHFARTEVKMGPTRSLSICLNVDGFHRDRTD